MSSTEIKQSITSTQSCGRPVRSGSRAPSGLHALPPTVRYQTNHVVRVSGNDADERSRGDSRIAFHPNQKLWPQT